MGGDCCSPWRISYLEEMVKLCDPRMRDEEAVCVKNKELIPGLVTAHNFHQMKQQAQRKWQ
jgi:hypothetical protein